MGVESSGRPGGQQPAPSTPTTANQQTIPGRSRWCWEKLSWDPPPPPRWECCWGGGWGRAGRCSGSSCCRASWTCEGQSWRSLWSDQRRADRPLAAEIGRDEVRVVCSVEGSHLHVAVFTEHHPDHFPPEFCLVKVIDCQRRLLGLGQLD